MRPLTGLATAAADLLFPPECLLCQRSLLFEPNTEKATPNFRDFCPACLAELTAYLLRCARCGASAALLDDGVCDGCLRAAPPWQRLVVLAGYGDLAREAVVRAKRPAGEPIGMALGRRLGALVQSRLPAVRLDLVVPVPMHWRRRALRGTSSAGVIASATAGSLGVRNRRLLRRIRATSMQNTLPPEQRPANVTGAFQALSAVRGQRVLVVDDVITTGATLAACTQALLAAGAQDVYVSAVAKAERTTLVAADGS